VHGLLEKWFRNRVPPPAHTVEGKLAQAMLLHYPPPQAVDPNNVELEYTFRTVGISFWLAVDLYLPGPMPTICDHKTTSDLKWAMEASDMHKDVQATLYAAWGMLKSNAPSVKVRWVYGTDKGAPKSAANSWQPKTKLVERELRGADVRERFGLTIETAKTIRAVRDSGCSAIDVPYDASACEQYGGCPYRDRCNLSAEERMEAMMSGPVSRSDLLAKLKANKSSNGASAPQPVNPPAAAAAPPVAPAAPAGELSLAERIRLRKEGSQANPVPETPAVVQTVGEAVEAPQDATPVRRGPGRPRGSGKSQETTPTPAPNAVVDPALLVEQVRGGRWASFAANSLDALIGIAGTDALDAASHGELVATAASLADALEAEYQKRCGGK
jgi:hypothetical protein